MPKPVVEKTALHNRIEECRSSIPLVWEVRMTVPDEHRWEGRVAGSRDSQEEKLERALKAKKKALFASREAHDDYTRRRQESAKAALRELDR